MWIVKDPNMLIAKANPFLRCKVICMVFYQLYSVVPFRVLAQYLFELFSCFYLFSLCSITWICSGCSSYACVCLDLKEISHLDPVTEVKLQNTFEPYAPVCCSWLAVLASLINVPKQHTWTRFLPLEWQQTQHIYPPITGQYLYTSNNKQGCCHVLSVPHWWRASCNRAPVLGTAVVPTQELS